MGAFVSGNIGRSSRSFRDTPFVSYRAYRKASSRMLYFSFGSIWTKIDAGVKPVIKKRTSKRDKTNFHHIEEQSVV